MSTVVQKMKKDLDRAILFARMCGNDVRPTMAQVDSVASSYGVDPDTVIRVFNSLGVSLKL